MPAKGGPAPSVRHAGRRGRGISGVMAGLVPAIHGCSVAKDVDARDKPGHDGRLVKI
jgi:hypothetical protein